MGSYMRLIPQLKIILQRLRSKVVFCIYFVQRRSSDTKIKLNRFPEFEVSGVAGDGGSEHSGGLSLSVGLHNLLLLLLLGFLDGVCGTLGLLLGNLLGLHGGGVLLTEAELGEGDIVQDYIEVAGSIDQLFTNQHRDLRRINMGDLDTDTKSAR